MSTAATGLGTMVSILAMVRSGGTAMWKYIRRYLPFVVLAGLFMIGEVLMDLIQPGIMSRIVDEGVLGLNNGGAGDLHLRQYRIMQNMPKCDILSSWISK